jgi:hypothetical protein
MRVARNLVVHFTEFTRNDITDTLFCHDVESLTRFRAGSSPHYLANLSNILFFFTPSLDLGHGLGLASSLLDTRLRN